MGRWLCVIVVIGAAGCVEPTQAKPKTPIDGGTCRGTTPIRAPVGGPSPRDAPEGEEEGYGYEFADRPLCAGGGIMGFDPPDPKPVPTGDEAVRAFWNEQRQSCDLAGDSSITIADRRPEQRYVVVDTSGNQFVIDLGAREIVAVAGADGASPDGYASCTSGAWKGF